MEDKLSVESINERLQEFEKTFAALQQQMDTDDYHGLVAAYTKKEEENFALFRYVQGISNEIEQLEDEKSALERETQKCCRLPADFCAQLVWAGRYSALALLAAVGSRTP